MQQLYTMRCLLESTWQGLTPPRREGLATAPTKHGFGDCFGEVSRRKHTQARTPLYHSRPCTNRKKKPLTKNTHKRQKQKRKNNVRHPSSTVAVMLAGQIARRHALNRSLALGALIPATTSFYAAHSTGQGTRKAPQPQDVKPTAHFHTTRRLARKRTTARQQAQATRTVPLGFDG